jgi:hypothetical protein
MNTLFSKTMNTLLCSGLLCLGSSLGAMNQPFNNEELTPGQLRKSLSKNQIDNLIVDVFKFLWKGKPLRRADVFRIFKDREIKGIPKKQRIISELCPQTLGIPVWTILNKIPLKDLRKALEYALKGQLCGNKLKDLQMKNFLEENPSFTSKYFDEKCFERFNTQFNKQFNTQRDQERIDPLVLAFFGQVQVSEQEKSQPSDVSHRGDAQRLSQLGKSISKEQTAAIIKDIFGQLKATGFLICNEIRQIAEKHGVIIPRGPWLEAHFPNSVLRIPPATVLREICPDCLEKALEYALKGELYGEKLKSLLSGDVEKLTDCVKRYFKEDCFAQKQRKRRLPTENQTLSPKRLKESGGSEELVIPPPAGIQPAEDFDKAFLDVTHDPNLNNILNTELFDGDLPLEVTEDKDLNDILNAELFSGN